jgi:hypothetical protein
MLEFMFIRIICMFGLITCYHDFFCSAHIIFVLFLIIMFIVEHCYVKLCNSIIKVLLFLLLLLMLLLVPIVALCYYSCYSYFS